MELFDFINIIFTDPVKFKEVTNGEKQKNYFMLNRRFAIQFPMQANVLQLLKINQIAVIDYWHNFLRKYYKTVPSWIYAKGIKKTKEIKEKSTSINNELIIMYSKTFELDSKSIKSALEFYPEQMIKELHDFSRYINYGKKN